MGANNFSDFDKDVIGEILNISLGASATAVSSMLSSRVDITTPVVEAMSKNEFRLGSVEPAIGVEITYQEGLTGNNIMLLKRQDVKVIVEMLMGMEIPDDEFEMNEMNISAICEVMNQMMGASATALSEFLGRTINISTPVSFEIESEDAFKDKYFTDDNPMVVIGFTLTIADKLKSEFMNVMPMGLAKELIAGLVPEDSQPQETAEEKVPEPVVKEEPKPEAQPQQMEQPESSTQPQTPQPDMQAQPQMQPAQPQMQQPDMTAPQPQMQPVLGADMGQMQQMQQMMTAQMQQMQQMMAQMQQRPAPDPKQIPVQPIPQPNLSQDPVLPEEQEENLELIMGVPLEVSVEIGRTKKYVKDILDFTSGSLVELDKSAGEQVDLYVNGLCIAKGDVVVVEDNFGIRITEIVKKNIEKI